MKEHISEFRKAGYVDPVPVQQEHASATSTAANTGTAGTSPSQTTATLAQPRKASGSTPNSAAATPSDKAATASTVPEAVETTRKELKKRVVDKATNEHSTKSVTEAKRTIVLQPQLPSQAKATIQTATVPSASTQRPPDGSSRMPTAKPTSSTGVQVAASPQKASPVLASSTPKAKPTIPPPPSENMWRKTESVQQLRASLSGNPVPSQRQTPAEDATQQTDTQSSSSTMMNRVPLNMIPEFVPSSHNPMPGLTLKPPPVTLPTTTTTTGATGEQKFVVPTHEFVPRFNSTQPVKEDTLSFPELGSGVDTNPAGPIPPSAKTMTIQSPLGESDTPSSPLLSSAPLFPDQSESSKLPWESIFQRFGASKAAISGPFENESNDSDDDDSDNTPMEMNTMVDRLVDGLLRDDRNTEMASEARPPAVIPTIPTFVPRRHSPPIASPYAPAGTTPGPTAIFIPHDQQPPQIAPPFPAPQFYPSDFSPPPPSGVIPSPLYIPGGRSPSPPHMQPSPPFFPSQPPPSFQYRFY